MFNYVKHLLLFKSQKYKDPIPAAHRERLKRALAKNME
jgi:hypothetical protein